MWWPRPRWKRELFTHLIFLLFVLTTTTTKTVMADDEGQLCGGSNMSAVVWTTAFCTILLVLVIVAIYFVYCKRKEHDWSSLWWKNSSDKNLVLQTSLPAKEHQQKNGGTDNPAFSADTNVGDHVTKTGLTRIVSVPLSAIDDGLLGIELSPKNKEDGKQMYTYKQTDGSKDRLVAMRLVFDKGPRQPCTGSPSDLNRTLVELSRKYGLVFELETEREAVTAAAVDENGNGPAVCAKRNLLTAVRGKAQRLWNQRQLVFKTGDGNDDGLPDKDQSADDLESGRAGATAPVQARPCTVTTVSETEETAVVQQIAVPAQNVLAKYHTLEYGASAQLSPDSGVHCCTVNPPEPVAAQMEASAAQVTADRQNDTARAAAAAAVCDEKKPKTDSDGEPTTVTGAASGARHSTASNPPPPPPRKYSAQVVQSANATAVRPDTSPAAAVTAPPGVAIAPDVASPLPVAACSASPDKTAAAPVPAKHEIRMDDDYYWCTTTSMAPPMSTFGKRSSATDGPAITNAVVDKASTGTVGDAGADGGVAADTVVLDDMEGGGIEDASLPPFSSDDDDDDDMDVENSVFAEKIKLECPAVTVVAPVSNESNVSSDGHRKDKAATKGESPLRNGFSAAENGVAAVLAPASESKSPTKLPSLKLSLSSPLSSTASCCSSSSSSSSASSSTSTSSASSTTSCTSSSPTNNNNNNSPIVSKIPVRRQSSSGCSVTVPAAVSTPLTNGTPKKSIPLPLSRSGSRLAMWSSAN